MTAALLTRTLGLLLPPRCPGCGITTDRPDSLCVPCWQSLHFLHGGLCVTCGHPFGHPVPAGTVCGACLTNPPPFTTARTALAYEGLAIRLVSRYKYYDRTYETDLFARWMSEAGKDCLDGATLIVPVPLHWRRLVTRRYNQSALLAAAIAHRTGLPFQPDALRRTRHTPPQTGLKGEARRKNVRTAFQVPPSRARLVAEAHIVLIDDVMTTGATVRACARALMKAGAASVRVLTLARTVWEHP